MQSNIFFAFKLVIIAIFSKNYFYEKKNIFVIFTLTLQRRVGNIYYLSRLLIASEAFLGGK